MSIMRDVVDGGVELDEVRFSASVAGVCEMPVVDIISKKHRDQFGCRLFFCSLYVVIERPGYVPESISFSLVRSMRTLQEAEAVGSERAAIAARQKAKEQAEKERVAKERADKAAAQEESRLKALAAKKANPNFNTVDASDEELEAVEVAVADMAAEPSPTPEIIASAAELTRDLAADGGMSDEEQRSMAAAVSRNKRGRK